jgi:hypothetical protein
MAETPVRLAAGKSPLQQPASSGMILRRNNREGATGMMRIGSGSSCIAGWNVGSSFAVVGALSAEKASKAGRGRAESSGVASYFEAAAAMGLADVSWFLLRPFSGSCVWVKSLFSISVNSAKPSGFGVIFLSNHGGVSRDEVQKSVGQIKRRGDIGRRGDGVRSRQAGAYRG